MQDVWLSVHPRWAQKIVDGIKTVEFRRRAPTLRPGSRALIYSTSPECSIVASAIVLRVENLSPTELWNRYETSGAVPREEFDAYFLGSDSGVAIVLSHVRELQSPVSLSTLRTHSRIRPAQGWRYLEPEVTDSLVRMGEPELLPF